MTEVIVLPGSQINWSTHTTKQPHGVSAVSAQVTGAAGNAPHTFQSRFPGSILFTGGSRLSRRRKGTQDYAYPR